MKTFFLASLCTMMINCWIDNAVLSFYQVGNTGDFLVLDTLHIFGYFLLLSCLKFLISIYLFYLDGQLVIGRKKIRQRTSEGLRVPQGLLNSRQSGSLNYLRNGSGTPRHQQCNHNCSQEFNPTRPTKYLYIMMG